MSSVPNLPLHAEFYGACALSRSRRLALMLTCGLCLAVLALAHMQPKRSVPIAAVAPLALDMRILPASAPSMAPQAVPELRPLLAEHSPIGVNLPPAERVLPQESPVVEKVPPQEKIKAREREKPKPKARQQKPVPKAAPDPTPVKAPESVAAPASAAVAGPVATAQGTGQDRGQNRDQPSGQASGQASGEASEQEKAVALGLLMQAIERYKSYPKQARRTGAQGTVSLLVSVGQDGRVKGWEVRQGSGHVLLDSATRQLGEKLNGLDTGLRGKEVGIVVPVRYALR